MKSEYKPVFKYEYLIAQHFLKLDSDSDLIKTYSFFH